MKIGSVGAGFGIQGREKGEKGNIAVILLLLLMIIIIILMIPGDLNDVHH